MEDSIFGRYQEKARLYTVAQKQSVTDKQKETLRGNGGCKPKPTAYEKTFMVRTYLITISVADALTASFFGRFNVNTPLT